jgi:hypothetical protein
MLKEFRIFKKLKYFGSLNKPSAITLLLLSVVIVSGCASGHCRGRSDLVHKKVKVFKADGTRQCEKVAAIPLDKMATELKDIEIFSKENRSDGRMHIALCGASTGKVNIFEIKMSDLEKAKALGFAELKD